MSVQNIADSATTILEHIVHVADEHNQTVDEHNQAIDHIEELQAQVDDMQAVINEKNRLLDKQNDVIEKAVEHKGVDKSEISRLKAELKQLQKLDPKRLEKVNKKQKATIAELKATLKDVEAKRKDAIRKTTELANKAKHEGAAPFYINQETGNSLRLLPNMFVSKDNNFGGVVGTPVLEFHHRGRGITRQGTLSTDGRIAWCSAQNSGPLEIDGQVAKDHVLEFCKRNNIKVKFDKEIKEAA